MAEKLAALFERKESHLKRAFNKTALPDRGWDFTDVTQCIFANVQRAARALLEERGLLRPPDKHENGASWIYWAEEPLNVSISKKSKK